MSWLLDTNVLSELRRPRPAPKVVAFISGQPLDLLYISVVTLAEIRFGIVTRDRGDYDKTGVPVINPWDAP